MASNNTFIGWNDHDDDDDDMNYQKRFKKMVWLASKAEIL